MVRTLEQQEVVKETPQCEFDVPADWVQDTFEISQKGSVLEGRMAHHENCFSIVVSEKGQDAVRVRKASDGRLSMALADGVSGSFLGAEAARAVTEGGLQSLANDVPKTESFKSAAKALDNRKINGRTFLEHAKHVQQTDDANSTGGWLEQSAASQFIKDDLLGSSTLDLGVFDSVRNKLTAGVSGDSPLYVYRARTGQLEVHTGGGQLAYRVRGSEAGSPLFKELNFDEGDIFLFASDGLRQEDLISALQGRSTGEAVLQGLQDHIERYGVEDDISVVGAVAQGAWWGQKS